MGSAWALCCWSAALLWERMAGQRLALAPEGKEEADVDGADAGVLSEGA